MGWRDSEKMTHYTGNYKGRWAAYRKKLIKERDKYVSANTKQLTSK